MSWHYEKKWVHAMQRLDDVVQEEEHDDTNDSMKSYQTYLQIYNDLNLVYKNIDNAQKRLAIGETLSLMTTKIIGLRNEIDSNEFDRKKYPFDLITPIPEFFSEIIEQKSFDTQGSSKNISSSKKLVRSLNTYSVGLYCRDDCKPKIDISSLLEEDFSSSEVEARAVLLQRHLRGYLTRSKLKSEKRWLRKFIGIEHFEIDKDLLESSESLLKYNRTLKENQFQDNILYQNALENIKNEIRKEEGLYMRQKIRDERVEWATNVIATTSNIPDIYDFYNSIDGKEKCIQTTLMANVKSFRESWIPCVHSTDSYSKQLAKDLFLRNEVYEELRISEDEIIARNFNRIKSSTVNLSKKIKSNRDGEKTKTKKVKGFPGDAIEDMKELNSQEMLNILTSYDMIYRPKEESLNDIISYPFESEDLTSSISEFKRALIEYCILPNISNTVKDSLKDEHIIRSILLYGLKGSGKSKAVRAAARELRAMVIEISPEKIPVSMQDQPDGPTKLIHMVFSVVKDPIHQPVIIFLNDCDHFFQPIKKKSSESLSSKFQKNLLIYKNQSINKDRVLIIGCTSSPSSMDPKILKWKGAVGKPEKQGFFERLIHVPTPGYMERVLIWENFVRVALNRHGFESQAVNIDYKLLSTRSEGYSAGMIIDCINVLFSSSESILRLVSLITPEIEVQLLCELDNESSVMNSSEDFAKFGLSLSVPQPTQDEDAKVIKKGNNKKK